MKRTFTFLFVFGVFGGCSEDNDCYLNNYQSITGYEINPNLTTPEGISVDTSGFDVDLEELDRQIDEMEICVQDALAGGIDLATAEAQDCRDSNWNYRTDFSDISVRRGCLIVKIAPDWNVSSCSEEYMEVFPCDMPAEVCENKGLEVTEECPCRCRSTIQDENIVVTTPDLRLFRGELARMMTGCNNPWFRPVSRCLLD
jgi:hypothetical protein